MTKAQDAKADTAGTAPAVDGDAMSAPDQLEAQQLVAQRADAVGRGDEQAVADIDKKLHALTGKK